RRHTRSDRDWSSDVCSSDLREDVPAGIEIVTLKDEGAEDTACLRAVFDMVNEIGPDIPNPDVYTASTFDMFLSGIRSPDSLHEEIGRASCRESGMISWWVNS